MLTEVTDELTSEQSPAREAEVNRLAVIARELRHRSDIKLVFALIGLVLTLWLISSLLQNSVMDCLMEFQSPLTMATGMLFSTGIAWYLIHSFRRQAGYRRRLETHLDHSSLLLDLATCSERLGRIFDYTPWPWRSFLGTRPVNLRGWLYLVGNNLDWYLESPRIRLHWEWFFVPLWPITLLLALIMIPDNQIKSWWNLSELLTIIVLFQLLIPALKVIQRRSAQNALLDAILARLDDDAKDEPDE